MSRAMDDLRHEHDAILSALGILFPALVQAGIPEQGGPVGQMLAEHAEGRRLIKAMEAAAGPVDAGAFAEAAGGYAALLRSHIAKENRVLFPIAERTLPAADLDGIFERFEQHEETVIGHGRHEALHALLEDLKRRYA